MASKFSSETIDLDLHVVEPRLSEFMLAMVVGAMGFNFSLRDWGIKIFPILAVGYGELIWRYGALCEN